MTQIPLLTTGLTGLVGSKLAQVFADTYEFNNLDINHPTSPVNITKLADVQRAIEASPAQFIVHFAAFTDVTAAWQQRGDKSGAAYQVNVVGTQNIVQAAAQRGVHVIHISTAYVFDGEKPTAYTEDDTPHPVDWYGQTKWEAEQAVMASPGPWTILRIDFPFRSDPIDRPDIVRTTINNLHLGRPLFTDHFFGPTFIDDFVREIDWVRRSGTQGLFHATNGEQWNDFQLGQLLNEQHHLGLDIKPGSLTEYLKTSQRPFLRNTALDTHKLRAVSDVQSHTVTDALALVELQSV